LIIKSLSGLTSQSEAHLPETKCVLHSHKSESTKLKFNENKRYLDQNRFRDSIRHSLNLDLNTLLTKHIADRIGRCLFLCSWDWDQLFELNSMLFFDSLQFSKNKSLHRAKHVKSQRINRIINVEVASRVRCRRSSKGRIKRSASTKVKEFLRS